MPRDFLYTLGHFSGKGKQEETGSSKHLSEARRWRYSLPTVQSLRAVCSMVSDNTGYPNPGPVAQTHLLGLFWGVYKVNYENCLV